MRENREGNVRVPLHADAWMDFERSGHHHAARLAKISSTRTPISFCSRQDCRGMRDVRAEDSFVWLRAGLRLACVQH